VLLPSAAAALGLSTFSQPAGPFTSTRARPVTQAAVRAASHPGTEVAAAEVDGEPAGRRGPWARLTRRKAEPGQPAAVTPSTSGPDRTAGSGPAATMASADPSA
jgi:hypothetical protein